MLIRTIIIAMLALPAVFLAMRYNMHMFQLNGYKNNEQINWLKKNIRQQWLLIFNFALGIIRIIFPCIGLDVVIVLTLILDILVYNAMKRLNVKKKLVFTDRVKRMMIMIFIIIVLILCLWGIFVGINSMSGLIAILVFPPMITIIGSGHFKLPSREFWINCETSCPLALGELYGCKCQSPK